MRETVPPSDELWVCHLGDVVYPDGVAMQERLRERRQAGEIPDTMLLLEHPPVYTRGRRAGADELPFGEDFYRAKGIDVVDTDRGGKLTYHGPGQLVGYPIMRIGAIDSYLRTMEQAIAAALAEQGIAARGRPEDGPDYTGVWVQDRKIASIGVHVSRGVTSHGFAVNVDNDLQPFSWVVACGLPEVQMTSIAGELGAARAPGLACFRKEMAYRFALAHGRRQRLVSATRLGIDVAHADSGAPTGAQPINTNHLDAATAVPA
ncbi:MAG: lipoyl(octanoyl) transferase LipB [Solirubrobacteraceae bacterium]